MRNAPGNCNGTAPEYADGTKGPLSRKKRNQEEWRSESGTTPVFD